MPANQKTAVTVDGERTLVETEISEKFRHCSPLIHIKRYSGISSGNLIERRITEKQVHCFAPNSITRKRH